MAVTKEQVMAAFDFVATIAQLIQAKGEIPSGELYATLMDKVNLSQYQTILRTLTNAKLIKVSGHLITWVGPPLKEGK